MLLYSNFSLKIKRLQKILKEMSEDFGYVINDTKFIIISFCWLTCDQQNQTTARPIHVYLLPETY